MGRWDVDGFEIRSRREPNPGRCPTQTWRRLANTAVRLRRHTYVSSARLAGSGDRYSAGRAKGVVTPCFAALAPSHRASLKPTLLAHALHNDSSEYANLTWRGKLIVVAESCGIIPLRVGFVLCEAIIRPTPISVLPSASPPQPQPFSFHHHHHGIPDRIPSPPCPDYLHSSRGPHPDQNFLPLLGLCHVSQLTKTVYAQNPQTHAPQSSHPHLQWPGNSWPQS